MRKADRRPPNGVAKQMNLVGGAVWVANSATDTVAAKHRRNWKMLQARREGWDSRMSY